MKQAVSFLLSAYVCVVQAREGVRADVQDPPAIDEFGEALSGYREDLGSGAARFVSGTSLRLTPVPDAPGATLDLNGKWFITSGPETGFENTKGDAFASWRTVDVPGDYLMQGIDGVVGYVRPFIVPADWKGRRVKLRCDEIACDSTLWVNGREIGRHTGQFIGFELDMTDAVRFGGENTIAVLVKKNSLARRVSGYSNHPAGGITRKIYAFTVPSVHVAMLHMATTFDDDFRDALCTLDIEVANEGTDVTEGVELCVGLVGANGKAVDCSRSRFTLPDIPGGKTFRRQVAFTVSNPLRWDSEHPNLYALTATLTCADATRHTTTRRIGFRQIDIRGNELLVNGKPVKLRGVNRHQAHPTLGRAVTPELDRKDAELFKAANCNFVRTSHYPPSEAFIAACDELGLFVEEEAPMSFFHPGNDKGLKQDDYTRYVVYANLKMVQRDRTHPSVLFWSIANESEWGPHFKSAAEAVAAFDPSRPRTFMWFPKDEKGTLLNIAAAHYPGMTGVSQKRKVPTIFSEFCHLPAYAPNEMLTDPSVDDSWGQMFESVWNRLYKNPGALGSAIWCGVDDHMYAPSADGKEKRFGVSNWGVIDGWRRPKPEYWHTKKTYSPAKVLAKRLPLPAAGTDVRIPVENRYNFSNLSELTITWRVGSDTGVVSADVAPRGVGELTVPVSEGVRAGDVLDLRFIHADGRVVDEYALPFGIRSPQAVEKEPVSWRLLRDGQVIRATWGSQCWRIDARTGRIIDAVVDGRPVLSGGPHLSYVKTFSKLQQREMRKRPVEPIFGATKTWQPTVVESKANEITWSGMTPKGALKGKYVFLPSGDVRIDYTFTPDFAGIWDKGDLVHAKRAGSSEHVFVRLDKQGAEVTLQSIQGKGPEYNVPIEKTAAVPRQLGLEFELPPEFDTLGWRRDAEWTVYPDDHIGRTIGRVKAFPLGPASMIEDHRSKPKWPWAHDALGLGCRDFRSTKFRVREVSLTHDGGFGLQVISDGTQNSRAYVRDGRVHLLVDDFGGGPSEGFMNHYFGKNARKRLAYGDSFSGTVRLRLRGM